MTHGGEAVVMERLRNGHRPDMDRNRNELPALASGIFLWIDRRRESLPFDPLERHIDGCPRCRERVERLERLTATFRTRCAHAPRCPSGLVRRIRLTIESE